MGFRPPPPPRKPEARTETVEGLVELVRRGLVRVPKFQRPLKWKSEDVVKLFDSIYRGFPVGSLLFYKRPAPAQRLFVGPVPLDAPEMTEAWWVVDGQQRVTSLVACLVRSVPIPIKAREEDPHVVYFDATAQKFEPPPRTGQIPTTWAPLPCLFDASQLAEWVFGWQHGDDEVLRRSVFEAGKRIREYPIPLYLIDTEDDTVAIEIFYRINEAGQRLEWTEVHKALFGDEGSSPSTLRDLEEALLAVGMGRFGEERLLTGLLALRGKDPTRTLKVHYDQDPKVLREAVKEALPVLRRVLSFLRQDVGIPHLRLLPKSILVDVLTRFFVVHVNPSSRTRALLARWYWRTVLGAGAVDDRTLRRRGISAVGQDEEETVQALLGLLHKERPRRLDLPAVFDARADDSRITLLALAHLHPLDLEKGEVIDVAAIIEKEDLGTFSRIVHRPALELARSPANRLLHSKVAQPLQLLRSRISADLEDPVLASHAIDSRAAHLLTAGDWQGFLARRAEILTEEVRNLTERMAAWDHSDRPSVDYLLRAAEAGA